MRKIKIEEIKGVSRSCGNPGLTGMAVGNGERLPMFVIGTPTCFKGVKNVPRSMGHNQKVGYHLNFFE